MTNEFKKKNECHVIDFVRYYLETIALWCLILLLYGVWSYYITDVTVFGSYYFTVFGLLPLLSAIDL